MSALHGTAVGDVLPAAVRAYESAMIELTTSDLNRRLETAIAAQAPPRHAGHLVKIKFAHQEAKNPPVVVIHGNRLDHLPNSYTRYLSNFLQSSYGLVGTRVRIKYRVAENPFRSRPREAAKRKGGR